MKQPTFRKAGISGSPQSRAIPALLLCRFCARRLRSTAEAAGDRARRSSKRQPYCKPIRRRRCEVVELPKPLPLPGQLKRLPRGKAPPEPADPTARVNLANAAARVQPVRDGFINAVQVYPFSGGALYQVYTAPGQVTDVALQEGEQLVGSGPVAAGDTVRWIIGDTESGAGATKARPHPGQADATRPHHQPRHQHRSADLSPRAALDAQRPTWRPCPGTIPQDQLIALRRQNAAAATAAPIDAGVDVSKLRFRYADHRRQSAVAAALGLRRRLESLYRNAARPRPGRGAAALRHRTARRRPARQLPRPPELLHRRSPVRRRRASARRRSSADRSHLPNRREAGMSEERTRGTRLPSPSRLASDPAASLRLRSERPRVTRLSRKVLAGGAAIALIAVSGAVFWALQNNRHARPRRKSFTAPIIARPRTALRACRATMPAFPAAAPPLGPPLPGDLGRPMLNAGAAPNTVIPAGPAVDPEAQRRAQEIEAARLSGCSPRPISASCRFRRPRRPYRRTPMPRRDRPRNPRPTPPSPRAARIENSPSSTLRSIAARRAPIGSQRPPRPLSCRPARSFPAR